MKRILVVGVSLAGRYDSAKKRLWLYLLRNIAARDAAQALRSCEKLCCFRCSADGNSEQD